MRRVLVHSLNITVHGPADTVVLTPGGVVDLDRPLGVIDGRPFTVADGLSADTLAQLLASPAPAAESGSAPGLPEAPSADPTPTFSRRAMRRAAPTTDSDTEKE